MKEPAGPRRVLDTVLAVPSAVRGPAWSTHGQSFPWSFAFFLDSRRVVGSFFVGGVFSNRFRTLSSLLASALALSSMPKFLRKIPFVRRIALAKARSIRQKQAEERWEYTQSVMSLIGQMTVTWAGVERMLDELIAHHQHNATNLEKEHPRSLSAKLEYLKRVMQRDLKYRWGAREFFRKTRIEAKRLGAERHHIIHGVLMKSARPVEWESQRVSYQGATARVLHRTFHNDDLVHLYKEMSAFHHYLAPRIWLLIGNDYRNGFTGEIEEIHSELLRTFPPIQIP